MSHHSFPNNSTRSGETMMPVSFQSSVPYKRRIETELLAWAGSDSFTTSEKPPPPSIVKKSGDTNIETKE